MKKLFANKRQHCFVDDWTDDERSTKLKNFESSSNFQVYKLEIY